MDQPKHVQPEELLEYHLGLLDEATAEQLHLEIAQSAETVTRSRNVAAWLKLLDGDRASNPPDAMVDQIMGRVEQTDPLRVTEAASSLPPSSGGRLFRRPVLSLRELVALAACITFFIGVVIPGVSQQRSMQRRTACANNLGSIGRGLLQYAADSGGMMPQTASLFPGLGWSSATGPVAVPVRRPARMSNSPNRFLLVRMRLVNPQSFICAAMEQAREMSTDEIDEFTDFPSPENCSFDSQNMSGPTLPIQAVPAMPVFADRNPLFAQGRFVRTVAAESNSRSHDGGSGQNVLSANGAVRWTESPVFGSQGDNIWKAEGVSESTGNESQLHPADAYIVP
ncbi:MAG: hypothetical protein GY842_15055 [bacterium]|nr:hypothetical protein [bacterium]